MRHVTDKTGLTYKRLLIFVTLFTFLTGTLTPAVAANSSSPARSSTETLQVGIGISQDSTPPLVQVTATQIQFDNPEQVQKLIHDQAGIEGRTIIVSSDLEAVIAETATQSDLPKNRFFLAPAGDFFKNFANESVKSVLNDKWGAIVLTYTVGADIYVWLHISTMTGVERWSNAIYTLGLALIYGLNKDAWSNGTKPIQNSLRKFFNVHQLEPTHYKELGVRFLANLTLGSAVALVRVPLISLSAIAAAGVQLNYFTMPLLANLIATTALFMWSEHMSMIDDIAYPRTKFIFRRVAEFRSLILGTLATTAALMHPDSHGYTPWITLGVLGVLGSNVYLKSDRLNRWVENHPVVQLLPSKMFCRNLFN